MLVGHLYAGAPFPIFFSFLFFFFFFFTICYLDSGLPGGSDGKESACSAGDPVLIRGSGRAPKEGNSYPLQYFCLENSMDRGAQRAA